VATLYLVSTPIGNLSDLSQRAVDTLRAVDRVLAEDTRRTGLLLKHLGISTKLISLHQHNEQARAAAVVEWMREGLDLALVSDAGTPLLSDPGAHLVDRVLDAGFRVVPVPGASALLAALVGSGLPADRFTFYAFLPRKGPARAALLEEIAAQRHVSVVYEAPGRLGRLLADIAESAGAGRRVVVARELTKLHEEFVRGSAGELAARYLEDPPLGEIVVVVDAAGEEAAAATEEATEDAARILAATLLRQGLSASAAARELRERLGLPRNTAYQIAQAAHAAGDTAAADPDTGADAGNRTSADRY
jgi:16S rRNA (cytidine1402-2'-O)-methyltransferase